MMLMILILGSSMEFWFLMNFLFIVFMIFLLNYPLMLMMSSLSYNLGLDNLSYWMIGLTLWIGGLMIMASMKIYKLRNYSGLFIFMVNLMVLFLVLTFLSLNMMSFYIFFEASLIPIVVIIMGWGYQPERIQAMYYLFFYTMTASLPMILFLFYMNYLIGSLDFLSFKFEVKNFFMLLMMSGVFLVKFPLFLVHLWLPKAHVEAPVSGSMVLAGVMLKLGGYGLMRFLKFFSMMTLNLGSLMVNFALLGATILSILCLRQSDLKSLIAYSSVVHMSLVLGGIVTLKLWGFYGALILMLGHGLCSSGLFSLVNMNYERFFSRSIYLNKGMINILPFFSLWWFLFLIGNMAAPPSLNLLGEISLINSLVGYFNYFMLFIFMISFFSAAYSLFVFSFSQHGKVYLGNFSYSLISIRENLILFLHWLPLNIFIMKSELFI
uniref:NADH-ubiquinone oxidoreductase chain 4 n=1 Tax=Rodolia quadrimaculata TaxID=2678939 RepID=A0A6B9MNR9_9CUCU|nr:NADH dehydrogenase subunit 4 [Rodolia quadrimaculata]